MTLRAEIDWDFLRKISTCDNLKQSLLDALGYANTACLMLLKNICPFLDSESVKSYDQHMYRNMWS